MARPSPAPTGKDPFRFLLLTIAATALAGLFVLPGWLSAGAVLLEAASACMLLRPSARRDLALLLAQPQVRWMLGALSAMLLAVTIVEIGHQELAWRRFEGPARMFLACAVFLAFALARVDFSRAAAWVFPLALALCAAWVFHPGATRFYWTSRELHERAATIFMDPIALANHSVMFGFICALLIDRSQTRARQVVLGAALVLALAVAIRTQSRTGWALVPLLALLLALRNGHAGTRRLAGTLLLVAAVLGAAYAVFPTVQVRLQEAVRDLHQYVNGGSRDTSLGLRLSMFRANLILFGQRPWLGWGYAADPDLLAVPAIRALYTPFFGFMWETSGGHNEYLQSMMRMGMVGLLSRLLVLLVPLAVFTAAARCADPVRQRNGFLGLVVVIGYLTAGLTQEVFNLSYSNSLYAVLVTLFAAGAIPMPDPARRAQPAHSAPAATADPLVLT